MRPLFAVLGAAATAALGAGIVGEYELRGLSVVVAGVLFGVVIAEVLQAAAGRGVGARLWPVAALLTAAGLEGARRIQWRYRETPADVFIALALGAVVSAVWLRTSRGPARDSPADPPR